MKKLLFLSISLSLAFAAQAVSFTINNVIYTVKDDGVSVEVDDQTNALSGNLVIPSSVSYSGKDYAVTSIYSYAFSEYTDLTSVTIPSSIKSISDGAFYYCSGLTSVTLPASVQYIRESAFSGCTALSSITIPDGVQSIENYAFQGCTSLASFSFPSSLVSIEYDAFKNTAWYDNQPDGLVYAGNVLYIYKGTMPDNTSIEIQEGTKGIAGEAFYGCDGLVSVTVPQGVVAIGDEAFRDCGNLISASFPDGVTWMGDYIFDACNNLPSVVLPTGISFLDNCFFRSCYDLTSVTIPQGVVWIGEYAFEDCYYLPKVIIPSSVNLIKRSAFVDCSSLKEVHSQNATPPTVEAYGFYNIDDNCTLYVPIGSKAAYQSATGWSDFATIVEEEVNGIPSLTSGLSIYTDKDAIVVKGAAAGEMISVYAATGIQLLTLVADGEELRIPLPLGALYFVKVGGSVVKVVL